MLSKICNTQWKYPTNHKDWTELVKQDLVVFEIPVDLDFIKSKSRFSISNLVKSNQNNMPGRTLWNQK